MERTTVINTIQELLRREPFVRFRIVLSSGDGYVIEGPYTLAMGDTTLHYYPRNQSAVHMRVNQIVAVEENAGPTQKRRKKAI